MRREHLKRPLQWLFLVAFVLASVELGLRPLVSWVLRGATARAFCEEYARKHPDIADGRKRLANPYWGIQYVPDPAEIVNNYGFLSGQDYPVPRDRDHFVVGIFGGSTAMALAMYSSNFAETEVRPMLEKAFPDLKRKKLVVVNLALEAGKQPQQLFAFSYFYDMFDLVINLEGFNELDSPYFPFRPAAYPGSYPIQYVRDWDDDLVADGARFLRGRRREALREVTQSPINRSATVFSLWYSAELVAARLQSLLENQAVSVGRETRKWYFKNAKITPEEEARIQVDEWVKYSSLESRIACSLGVPAYFFLQPNQYISGSKPFGPEERRIGVTREASRANPADRLGIDEKFRLARAELKKVQYNVVDLSYAFRNETEDLYIDSCCHWNPRGSQIVLRKILEAVVQGEGDFLARNPSCSKPRRANPV